MRILILFLSLFVSAAAQAAVKEIEVIADITGETPVDAQQKAVQYAKKRAFFLVLLEHDAKKAESIARGMSDAQIDANIRGYQLVQDKYDGNRYIAQFKVSVSDDLVGRLIAGDAGPGDEATNPVLVLPVYNANSELLLWEGDNVWRSIVNGIALERGENLLIMPYGDPTDLQTVNSATVLSYRYDDLKGLAERYGAREVVVALAELKSDSEPQGVTVTLRRLGPDGLDRRKSTFTQVAQAGEPPQSALPDAARAMADELKDIARYYEGEQERRIANASKLKLMAQFRRLKDWVGLKEKLQTLPQVVRLDIESIDIASADATLYFDGEAETMRQIMIANGLAVEEQGDRWTVAVY